MFNHVSLVFYAFNDDTSIIHRPVLNSKCGYTIVQLLSDLLRDPFRISHAHLHVAIFG